MDGVPRFSVATQAIQEGINIVNILAETTIMPSKGEARKMVQSNGISINKSKIDSIDYTVSTSDLLNEKYLLVQKGKKNYYLIVVK
jgi:tyrosyl-tRNA synthetase